MAANSSFIAGVAVVSILALALIKLLNNAFHSPVLRRIPGPAAAAFTKYWRLLSVWRGHAHLELVQLHRKHGKLVRIAPDVISVGDPAMIPVIYANNERFTKTAFYPIQSISWRKKPEMNLFSTRNPEEHRTEKRKIGAAYSLSNLLAAEDKVDSCTELFFKTMCARNGAPVDLGAWLQYYAFDVVGELTFAKKLGFLEEGKDVDGMMKAIEGMLAYASLCGQIPEWHTRLLGNPILTKLAPAMETWNQVLLFTLKAINARTEFKRDEELADAKEQGIDMLSRWRNVKSSNPDKMSTRDIIVHLSTNVFAGSDTTAIALRSVVYYLCRNSAVMDKVQTEIASADNNHQLSHPVRYNEVTTHLPYFCAVMKEAMRVHPSVGLIMERHVPAEGATICDKEMPPGTIVGINPWVLNYDASLFEDPESFEPLRWIDGTKEQLQARENILSFNFGAGARNCIGRHISFMEMHKVLPEMYRRFRVTLTNPEKEWEITNHWFVQQEGLVCNLTAR